jgi:alpha-galactosidase/6-phospho-beta-glucosidase family protein
VNVNKVLYGANAVKRRERRRLVDGTEGGGPKVVIVGGGSYQWGPKLVLDAAMNEDLGGGELVLHDTDPVALDDVFRWGERAVGLSGSGLKLGKTGKLGEALDGADFVVLSISTGGLDAMAYDLEIPERYGVVQTVGDTVGPGGIFRALRNIPVVVGLAREMERLCPGAVLLNLTNPLTVLTRAVTKTTSVRTIGLCHELFGTLEVLAEEFGVPEDRLDVEVAGVNHFIWITRVAAAGRDVTEEMRRRVTEGRVRDAVLEKIGGNPDPFVTTWGFRTEMCRVYGHLPAAGDRHLCEFVPGYLEDEGERERLDLRRTTIGDRKEKLAGDRELVRRQADGEEEIEVRRSREEISDVIGAIHAGTRSVNIANLPNEGQVENLPRGAVVETLAAIDGLGARGVSSGRLPLPVENLVRPHAVNQEMTVEAGLNGDRELAFQAFVGDPLISHHPRARRMFDEMFEAHAHLMPQF